jgi:hypothetical protein
VNADARSPISYQPPPKPASLSNFLKLLAEHCRGTAGCTNRRSALEAIDGNVKPGAFFSFHHELS